jgi:hypothetical protein
VAVANLDDTGESFQKIPLPRSGQAWPAVPANQPTTSYARSKPASIQRSAYFGGSPRADDTTAARLRPSATIVNALPVLARGAPMGGPHDVLRAWLPAWVTFRA